MLNAQHKLVHSNFNRLELDNYKLSAIYLPKYLTDTIKDVLRI